MSANPRAAAGQVLADVLGRGRSLSSSLGPADALPDARDRALARELCFGVLRWLPRLDAVLAQVMERPLKARDDAVRVALLLGLYQLVYLRVPDHAAVAESVRLVSGAGRPWAKGLVNAVLRRVQREREALLERADRAESAALAHPPWLIGAVRAAWPGDWRRILEANNAPAPMTLRVNARRSTRAAYLTALAAAGIEASPAPHTEHGIVLGQAREARALPGFAQGLVSVQDAAAQLAAPLLAPGRGARVLDACAAPGGKTAHLAECAPDLAALVALDQDANRLARIEENLVRLGLAARVVQGDAGVPTQWWDGHPFDRILLDAPCSATGVIRRHPDIKQLRRETDVDALAATQARLLAALWPLLARGGLLLYATCSILPRENAEQVQRFLASHPDATARRLSGPWGRGAPPGRQVLPGDDGMDGFFYALLEKS